MNAREVALAVVRDVFPAPGAARERGAQEALEYRAGKAKLSGRDLAFATELAYGAIKMRRTLDWYLEPFVGERRATLPAAIAEILRLAVFELVYTRADEHATLFEFVNLAKRYGHRGVANLTNAVLRSFLRDRPPAPDRAAFGDDAEFYGTRYSLPTWLVRSWTARFGDRIEAICEGVDAPARACVTVNVSRATPEEAAERLESAGVAVRRSAFVAESLVLERGAGIAALERSAAGQWWLQSESSAMAADVLNPQAGEAVLDVCSGRGNKALQIGARLGGEGTLLCIERDERRAATLARRLEQAGIAAGTVVGDASAALLEPGQRFDRILLDAPCSAVGVVGRYPEARWKKQPSDGERLAITQRALLERVARHIHPGGTLVYAVCSTDVRETTEVIDWFLSRERFERGLIPAAYEPFLTAEGDVLVPPGIDGRDGFFIARLEARA